MKYLVLGCNGMAGHTVSLYLKEKGDDVTGFARKQSQFVNTIIGDAFDTEHLKSIIDNDEYDYVINCIGLLNNDAEEYKSHAVYLNSFIPHMISDFTKESDTRLSVQIVCSRVKGGNIQNTMLKTERIFMIDQRRLEKWKTIRTLQ